MKVRAEKETNFYKAIRGVDDACIANSVPKVVKFIANEMSLLGDTFVQQTLEKSSVVDENDRILIDFESLVSVLQKLQYICNSEDRTELRVWLFNESLFASKNPKYFDMETIFIDVLKLMEALKR